MGSLKEKLKEGLREAVSETAFFAETTAKATPVGVAAKIMKSKEAGKGSDKVPKVARNVVTPGRKAYKKSGLPRGRV